MLRTSLLLSIPLSVLFSGCTADLDTTNLTEQESLVWHPVAGSATADFDPNYPFLQFIPTLDLANLTIASQGRELFIADWDAAPGTRPLLDGLGPLAIASSCDACHLPTGRAASLNPNGEVGVGLLFRLADSKGKVDPYYGGQLQTAATAGNSEGRVSWQLDSSGRPAFTLVTNQLALAEGIHLGPRLSPQLTGIGLLDLVTEHDILSREDEFDLNGDGISGRAHWHEVDGERVLGRFGWKAMQPSLRHQSAGAMQQDMGLTTNLNPDEPCTLQQTICSQQPSGGSPEVSDNSLDAINDFLSLLAVPERRIEDQETFDQGAKLFDELGCADCHYPTLTTGQSDKYPLLSNQLIYAYTDLLLHDLGSDLSDQVKEGHAEPSEWRTPPLWSLGLVEASPHARFLHDGRAKTIEQAVIWHGGEALESRRAFEVLDENSKQNLLIFLRGI
ncbi:di-heme oxidoredictase family protein [Reinekea sp.]|jgi:CxxC motif-containing protein (DUF1111 family)|uniref:di-heme oxidoredictase family protein n=1 Tax=Reinekea sp. TaxID=1970455 RepID=UPI00398925F6